MISESSTCTNQKRNVFPLINKIKRWKKRQFSSCMQHIPYHTAVTNLDSSFCFVSFLTTNVFGFFFSAVLHILQNGLKHFFFFFVFVMTYSHTIIKLVILCEHEMKNGFDKQEHPKRNERWIVEKNGGVRFVFHWNRKWDKSEKRNIILISSNLFKCPEKKKIFEKEKLGHQTFDYISNSQCSDFIDRSECILLFLTSWFLKTIRMEIKNLLFVVFDYRSKYGFIQNQCNINRL